MKIKMKLTKEEKDFVRSWSALFSMPITTIVVKEKNGYIRFGDNSWFWLRGKFNAMKKGKVYTIEELMK